MVAAGHVGKDPDAGVLVGDEANKTHQFLVWGWSVWLELQVSSLCLRLLQTAVYEMGPEPESVPAGKSQKGPLNKPVFTVRQESLSNEVCKNHVVQRQ